MDAMLIIRTFMDRLACFMLLDLENFKFVRYLLETTVTCYIRIRVESKHQTSPKSKDTNKSCSIWTNSSTRQRRWKSKNLQESPAWIKRKRKNNSLEINTPWLFAIKTDKSSNWLPNSWWNSQEQANSMLTFFKC